jgi:hypothetical protein
VNIYKLNVDKFLKRNEKKVEVKNKENKKWT